MQSCCGLERSVSALVDAFHQSDVVFCVGFLVRDLVSKTFIFFKIPF